MLRCHSSPQRSASTAVATNARTIGYAVGAGIARDFVTRSVVIPIASAPDDVHHGEHHDPVRVDEVPIQRAHVETAGLRTSGVCAESEDQPQRETEQAD